MTLRVVHLERSTCPPRVYASKMVGTFTIVADFAVPPPPPCSGSLDVADEESTDSKRVEGLEFRIEGLEFTV